MKTVIAIAGGSRFRRATVLKCFWLLRKAPSTVLAHPKITNGAQSRNKVDIWVRAATDLLDKSPFAMVVADTSINIRIITPTVIAKFKEPFAKR